jgi:hypothetical protein
VQNKLQELNFFKKEVLSFASAEQTSNNFEIGKSEVHFSALMYNDVVEGKQWNFDPKYLGMEGNYAIYTNTV